MKEKKAEEVAVLDVRDLTSFTDYFVLCNGESEPQLRTISRNIEEKMTAAGIRPHHLEGKPENGWLLMDYDDFVVHIFSPEKRSFYDLERLWADAPRIPVSNGASARAAR
jgi:ribosome-associated protein